MNTQKKAMVSPSNSWFESYFSADEAERRRLLFPMSVTLAFGTGLCDKDGWFKGCLKRRDELFALLETKLDGTAIGAERMGAVFTEWNQDAREQFFEKHGLSTELQELYALFAEAEDCKKVVDEILASESKTQPREASQSNPDWRVSRASWNLSEGGA
jgi:hypothetical protein